MLMTVIWAFGLMLLGAFIALGVLFVILMYSEIE